MKPTDAELRSALVAAQTALLERVAPETRVRRVTWSQGETQVLELGEGPPLLLVHGGGDCALQWAPVIPALAKGRRVIAVDRPGHGLADPFDYRGIDLLEHARTFLGEILDAVDVRAADVVACSMGALWAFAFALHEPSRVSRFVIAGAPPGLIRAVPLPLRMLSLPVAGSLLGRMLMANTTRDATRKFWGDILVAHPERLDDALLDADVAHTRRNYRTVLGLLRSALGARGVRRELVLADEWRTLSVPTLFLSGDRDRFMTRARADAWKTIVEQNPALKIVGIPDAGHLCWIDEPTPFMDETERFLAVPAAEGRL